MNTLGKIVGKTKKTDYEIQIDDSNVKLLMYQRKKYKDHIAELIMRDQKQ